MNECCHNENRLLSDGGIPDAATLDRYLHRGRVLRAAAAHAALRRIARLLDPHRLTGPWAIRQTDRAPRSRRELLALDEGKGIKS